MHCRSPSLYKCSDSSLFSAAGSSLNLSQSRGKPVICLGHCRLLGNLVRVVRGFRASDSRVPRNTCVSQHPCEENLPNLINTMPSRNDTSVSSPGTEGVPWSSMRRRALGDGLSPEAGLGWAIWSAPPAVGTAPRNHGHIEKMTGSPLLWSRACLLDGALWMMNHDCPRNRHPPPLSRVRAVSEPYPDSAARARRRAYRHTFSVRPPRSPRAKKACCPVPPSRSRVPVDEAARKKASRPYRPVQGPGVCTTPAGSRCSR